MMIANRCQELMDFSPQRFGEPQQAGPLTMVPYFGLDQGSRYVPPLSGLKLSKVKGYGNVEMKNPHGEGVAIVPLHIGYIQDGAQNHCLCRSAFIGGKQEIMFRDACCVQQSIGGYLKEKEQWFFILPLQLREKALRLRGVEEYGKLWPAISELNQQFGLKTKGHLDYLLCGERPRLNQYRNQIEVMPGQTGALFLINGQIVGLELTPTPDYFRELWPALLCFCYGVAAMQATLKKARDESQEKSQAKSQDKTRLDFDAAAGLTGLRTALLARRAEQQEVVATAIQEFSRQQFSPDDKQEHYVDLAMATVESASFMGQVVFDGKEVVYASIFAKQAAFHAAARE